jgi:hypothetical protein
MKQLFFVWTLWVCCHAAAGQATAAQSQFLFESFREGAVIYKNGSRFTVPVNYDLLSQCFMFLDAGHDNQMMEFADPSQVAAVTVGERIFRYDKGNVYEVIQPDPLVSVHYKGVMKDKGKPSAYGGTSMTGSVDSYAGMQSGGKYYRFDKDKGPAAISRIACSYRIEVNKKAGYFTVPKQFMKLYPQHKEALAGYIKENGINFDSPGQVVKLCNYAASLSM